MHKYYKKRIGKIEDSRCSDCGEDEEEEKDHWWTCPRWEMVRRELRIEGVKDMSDEGKMLRYVKRVKRKWIE